MIYIFFYFQIKTTNKELGINISNVSISKVAEDYLKKKMNLKYFSLCHYVFYIVFCSKLIFINFLHHSYKFCIVFIDILSFLLIFYDY